MNLVWMGGGGGKVGRLVIAKMRSWGSLMRAVWSQTMFRTWRRWFLMWMLKMFCGDHEWKNLERKVIDKYFLVSGWMGERVGNWVGR